MRIDRTFLVILSTVVLMGITECSYAKGNWQIFSVTIIDFNNLSLSKTKFRVVGFLESDNYGKLAYGPYADRVFEDKFVWIQEHLKYKKHPLEKYQIKSLDEKIQSSQCDKKWTEPIIVCPHKSEDLMIEDLIKIYAH